MGAEMDTSCCCGAGNGDLFRDIRAVLARRSELALLRKYDDDRMFGAGFCEWVRTWKRLARTSFSGDNEL